MNFFRKANGAVTIFLVIILVPCILVASVFVDLGRVQMSKSLTQSAGDLALNSLMSHYDADLSEWYGMVVSCQSIDEFYEISAEYFLRAIKSQGISDEEIYLLSDYYAQVVDDTTIYDLLKTECNTDTSAIISAVDGADMTNATVIKEQIVEFMKYRAPIELTIDLVGRLRGDTELGIVADDSIAGAIEAEENAPLVEDKQEFYAADGELSAASYNTYKAIKAYYDAVAADGFVAEKDQLIKYAEQIKGYEQVYKDVHAHMVKNLFNTAGLNAYNRVTATETYSYSKDSWGIYSRYWKEEIPAEGEEESEETETDETDTEEEGEEPAEEEEEAPPVIIHHYYISDARINSLLNDLRTAITNFEYSKSEFETAVADLMSAEKAPGTPDTASNCVQWWVQMDKIANAKDDAILSNGKAMMKACAKVMAIGECEYEDDVPAHRYANDIATLTGKVNNYVIKYLTAGVVEEGDAYLRAVNDLELKSRAFSDSIVKDNLKVTIHSTEKGVDEALAEIQTNLTNIKTALEGYIALLDIAIEGKWHIKKSERVRPLDDLVALVNDCKTKLNTWEGTATSLDTTMADADETEIEGLSVNWDWITAENVQALKTRLINIRTQMKDLISEIDNLKYGSKKMLNISNYSTMRSAVGSQVDANSIPLKNSDLDAYVESTFSALYSSNEKVDIVLSHKDDNNYHPVIAPDSGDVETPEFYKLLYDKYKNNVADDVKSNQDALEDSENKGKEKEDAAKNRPSKDDSRMGSDIAKDFSGGATMNIADGLLTSTISLLDSLMNLNFEDIRDDLYVTSYVMNMFSHAAYENQGKYQIYNGYDPDGAGATPAYDVTALTLNNYETEYGKVTGTAKTASETQEAFENRIEGLWLSPLRTDSYNKSLTNKMINPDNNAAFLAEIEYILNGKSNKENIKAVYGNIYAIRYALNLVSGFANFWSPSGFANTNATAIDIVANAVMSLTGGIVPAPVTKVVLIPLLTVFETALDLDRLEAGFPVELYKAKHDNWFLALPSFNKGDGISKFMTELANLNPKEKENPGKGFYYSDYLMIFVYLALQSSYGDDVYQRIAEVMQANMRKITGKDSGDDIYKMSNAKVYFRLNAEIKVDPLMIDIPYFDGTAATDMKNDTTWCTYDISMKRGY